MKLDDLKIGIRIKGIGSEDVYTVTEVTDESVFGNGEPRKVGDYVVQDSIEIPLELIDKFEVVEDE